MAMSISLLSALNVQSASKDELMCIKGIGDKKANQIMKYRKSGKLKSTDDLLELKGFGKVLVKNIKQNIKSVACGGKKTTKKTTTKKSTNKSIKETSSKKTDTKKTDTTK
ncbi:MAG: Late competence protein ComEA, DNA receptor [uncultured Sulfurovum sp.]|uniref:Late competence protein ComEA, DNA receptor n=1 Tax=uncultured Sulfurovum sp. TaxID=269237 RepID=A0A6S6U2P0_9BACT|nr:MAG: Late competence protein ComEA, DNA receptor [uncultured Sulfurovum sp.]